jgi:hypothetical protein
MNISKEARFSPIKIKWKGNSIQRSLSHKIPVFSKGKSRRNVKGTGEPVVSGEIHTEIGGQNGKKMS